MERRRGMKLCGLFGSLKETCMLLKTYMELKAEVAAMRNESRKLKEQIKALEDDKKNPLIFSLKDGLYYYADDTASKYPYCPACYEAAQKRIRLPKYTPKCPACGNRYYEGGTV
jgi:hypothetical protein